MTITGQYITWVYLEPEQNQIKQIHVDSICLVLYVLMFEDYIVRKLQHQTQ